jgi:8-oxo-dGTP pyrophosphatase MutT (NUDIX family)
MIDAAIRETDEELGVSLIANDLQPLCTMLRTQGNDDLTAERVDFFYQCERWDGVPQIMEPHKVSALEWFELGALPEPVVPHELRILEALTAGEVPILMAEGFKPES